MRDHRHHLVDYQNRPFDAVLGWKFFEGSVVEIDYDKKTLFVGVQHPGEKGNSHWPDGGDSVPRSSIVAISRDDGGLMG